MTDSTPATAACREVLRGAWHHARWFEPHLAVVNESKPITTKQQHDGTTQKLAACLTCGEVLIAP